MPRYCYVLEYDGSFFSGWQLQPGKPTVQGTLSQAMYALTQEQVEFHGAGRTDQGVHAWGQVAHVDLGRRCSLDVLRRGLNFYLRDQGVVVRTVQEAGPDFHARFSALSRTYCYRILNRPSPSVLHRQRVWWVYHALDIPAMQQAAAFLCGHHDFSSFRDSACQARSALRTLDSLTVCSQGPWIDITAQARSFLHHQVRIMVGALVEVGKGRWDLEKLRWALDLRHRDHGAPTAPPEGLYFIKASYPAPYETLANDAKMAASLL